MHQPRGILARQHNWHLSKRRCMMDARAQLTLAGVQRRNVWGCSRQGSAVKHLHSINGGLITQDGGGPAGRMHIREHHKRRRLRTQKKELITTSAR